LNENDREYILDVVKGVLKSGRDRRHHRKFSKGWKLSRISKVDLAILRLAIYEMCHRMTYRSPWPSTRLSNWQRTTAGRSGSFINGIWGKLSK